ncbi:MAG: diversity-generating retroelement protein Avd [Patescibacteria group bacterium]
MLNFNKIFVCHLKKQIILFTHTHTHTDSIFDIPIFSKLYEFYKETYQVLKKFPQRDRYSLGQKIESSILETFELLSKTNAIDKTKKLEILESANSKIDLIKVLIRLSKDNNCINKESYLNLQENLHEIGKMAGGWIRYLKNA